MRERLTNISRDLIIVLEILFMVLPLFLFLGPFEVIWKIFKGKASLKKDGLSYFLVALLLPFTVWVGIAFWILS